MPSSQPSGSPQVKTEPTIKTEPGLDAPPSMSQGTRPAGVQERVIQQLQSQYGERAAGSIDKLKAGMGMQTQNGSHPQGQPRPGPPMPQQPAQYQGSPQQQFQQQNMPHRGLQQQQPPNGQRPPSSQMDGAGDGDDCVGVLVRQTQDGQTTELGRVDIDNMLHAQIAARAKAMEGGGLMVPLRRTKKAKSSASHYRTPDATAGPARYDGDDDVDDVDDEDAINSDLDDPEDNLDDDDEDEDGGHIMLCMYDKVQRVKNKW